MTALIRAALFPLAAAALAASPATHALTLVSSTLGGNAIDASFSTPSLAAVDIQFRAPGSVSLVFELDGDDVARGSAGFNSIIDNLSATGFGRLDLELDRGTLSAGDAVSNDGDVVIVPAGPRAVGLEFLPPITTQAYLGNALLTGSAADWTIGFGGLAVGDRLTFTVTAAVPEPTTWALMLAGVALVAVGARRGRV